MSKGTKNRPDHNRSSKPTHIKSHVTRKKNIHTHTHKTQSCFLSCSLTSFSFHPSSHTTRLVILRFRSSFRFCHILRNIQKDSTLLAAFHLIFAILSPASRPSALAPPPFQTVLRRFKPRQCTAPSLHPLPPTKTLTHSTHAYTTPTPSSSSLPSPTRPHYRRWSNMEYDGACCCC